jgi:hypothetical protein
MRAFALIVPAQSTGRYVDLDWDAVLAEYNTGVIEQRKSGKSKSGKSESGKSKNGKSKR